MPDASQNLAKFALIAFGAGPFVFAVIWSIIEHDIRPARIPRREIDRLADELMARRHDDPEGAAFRREEAAWSSFDHFEQGKWRRVRGGIRRRRRGLSPKKDPA
jgi:hypothetical protein